MRKKISYDEYMKLLGHVPEGKKLVMTSTGMYYIEDVEIHPIQLEKKGKKKK